MCLALRRRPLGRRLDLVWRLNAVDQKARMPLKLIGMRTLSNRVTDSAQLVGLGDDRLAGRGVELAELSLGGLVGKGVVMRLLLGCHIGLEDRDLVVALGESLGDCRLHVL